MTSGVVGKEPWVLRLDGTTGTISSLESTGEPLTAQLTAELAARGLVLQRRDASANQAIRRASGLIARVPSLERVVLTCVRDISILESHDPHIDVSHSEPRWPNLIFVSVPPDNPVGDVRLAEAVIHEAMHLNLSLLECRVRLVKVGRQLYSPWRSAPRPAGGVLHGLYVFVCLLRFFEILGGGGALLPDQQNHLSRRRTQILDDCAGIGRDELFPTLTIRGRTFLRKLFEIVDEAALRAL